MSLWVVRAGKRGEQEETAIKKNLVCHGWNDLPDYSGYPTKDELRVLYKAQYPRETDKQVISGLGQVWRFAREIRKGDLVALPLKAESAFAFGRITGEYQYEKVAPNVMHIRCVEWLKTVPRSIFPKDILFSMNSALTVFSVYRNEAENRVNDILAFDSLVPEAAAQSAGVEIEGVEDEEAVDLAATARDEIIKFIEAEFKGHGLANLVAAILESPRDTRPECRLPDQMGALTSWRVQGRSGLISPAFACRSSRAVGLSHKTPSMSYSASCRSTCVSKACWCRGADSLTPSRRTRKNISSRFDCGIRATLWMPFWRATNGSTLRSGRSCR